MYRLIDKETVERIKKMLEEEYEKAKDKLKDVEWKPLPEKARSRTYAIDGSQGKVRLSGVVIYTVSSFAFGNGPSYRLVYTNAMLYNQDISDQIIRLQMETLENKLGYFVGDKVDFVLMDGSLTGSLTRPPVYPESVRGIATVCRALGEKRLKAFVDEFLGKLEDHYAELENRLEREKRIYNGILADSCIDEYSHYTEALKGCVYGNDLSKFVEKAVEMGYDAEVVEDILRVVFKEEKLSKEDARNTIHVILSYLEYLYSLERLLDRDVVYVAKSFYSRKIARDVGLDIVDSSFLDAYLREVFGEESTGYISTTFKVRHEVPKVLKDFFPNVFETIKRGVSVAYVRAMKGGNIYMVQSNRRVDDMLGMLLWHESNGYFRPLQKSHEGVKIEKKRFDMELAVLINMLSKDFPEVRIFTKYGRSPLE
ncbi:DNA double-strand break repair nuclease NurA [Archaeoglobus sp.]